MWEKQLVRHCSPTLAGLKTGSVFTVSVADEEELRCTLRRLNGQFRDKGLRVIPLRRREGRALIYVYRPCRLRQDLGDETAGALLGACGYCRKSPEGCIAQLIKRLEEREDFPHEIGLFLGYPPEDVAGFIRNDAENYKCCGVWKVYTDVEAAQRTFDQYRKCTQVYCSQWEKGADLRRLTVASQKSVMN